MRKYVVCVLGALLLFAGRSRADSTVSDGSPDSFAAALEDAVDAGGGTITVTTPILIASTNGGDQSFDGVSNVVVSGGSTNSIFLVLDAELDLANFSLKNGVGTTNGGAIFVSPDGTLVATNCMFANNSVLGTNGLSSSSDTNTPNGTPPTGKNGGKGTSAQSAFGGAVFNLGDASFLACQFLTNSAIGGDGGDGGDGADGANRGGDGGSGGGGGSASGGAIFNGGSLLLVDSTFSGNLASGGKGGTGGAAGSGFVSGAAATGGIGGNAAGAGLFSLNADASVTIANCTFNNNTAQGGDSADGGFNGSGIGQSGRSGGSAFGVGFDSAGALMMTNSTFFENNANGGTGGNGGSGGARAGNGGNGGNAIGGGLYNAGTVSAVNCTFSKGAAAGGTNGAAGSGISAGRGGKRGSSQGGNIANVAKKKIGSLTLVNSIIGTALFGGSASGTIVDGGFNICADKTIKFKKKGTSKANLNPMIGDLADNGGPTETIPLLSTSPAVDKIDPADAPATDQRGVTRPQIVVAALSDIGAFELNTNTAVILLQPQSTNVIVGSNALFSVTAGGAGPLFFQWFFNGSILTNQTGSSLLITNVQTTNAGNFQVVVSNSFNSVTSRVAVLTVTLITNSAPVITNQPASVTVAAGSTATFTVGVTGTPPLFYQWVFQVNSTVFTNIPNATNVTFSITNAQTTNAGNYAVAVTNAFGFANSTVATLFITNADTNTPPPPTGPPSPGLVDSGAGEGMLQHSALMPLKALQNSGAPAAMNFTFSSEVGATYVIEYKKSLADTDWVPISTNTGTGDWLTNRVLMTNQPSGFYRAVRR